MKTHHGRPGGRGLELLLLLLTILATVTLIGGGFLAGLAIAEATNVASPRIAAKAGAGLGFLFCVMLWRKVLASYRYDHDLKPIRSKEDII